LHGWARQLDMSRGSREGLFSLSCSRECVALPVPQLQTEVQRGTALFISVELVGKDLSALANG
jgi:hypothetical protein